MLYFFSSVVEKVQVFHQNYQSYTLICIESSKYFSKRHIKINKKINDTANRVLVGWCHKLSLLKWDTLYKVRSYHGDRQWCSLIYQIDLRHASIPHYHNIKIYCRPARWDYGKFTSRFDDSTVSTTKTDTRSLRLSWIAMED